MPGSLGGSQASKPVQLTVSTKEIGPDSPRQHSPDPVPNGRLNMGLSTPVSLSNGFDTDVEAVTPVKSTELINKRVTGEHWDNAGGNVWPGQAHWKEKARVARLRNRSCRCMAGLSKQTRIIVKIAIALLVIGIAIGVGVGISKPLGAAIWKTTPP
ncbi:hypothetical protein F5Y18DRAFT_302097 [Xylariaceae sp. FL1019]|nr:hypothetical protein F5Y18DRAFT_302097 [Xylariaceae sp. FL1019]